MGKYLFIFKNQNVLIKADNKIDAINVINEKYKDLLYSDFRVITVSVELDEHGNMVIE